MMLLMTVVYCHLHSKKCLLEKESCINFSRMEKEKKLIDCRIWTLVLRIKLYCQNPVILKNTVLIVKVVGVWNSFYLTLQMTCTSLEKHQSACCWYVCRYYDEICCFYFLFKNPAQADDDNLPACFSVYGRTAPKSVIFSNKIMQDYNHHHCFFLFYFFTV